MLLLIISLLAGALTILAPCVLPVLPVIVGGSIGGKKNDKLRPYIIAGSLIASIVLFTLILKVSTVFINLSPHVLNWLSGTILILLGVASVFPELWEKFIIRFNLEAASLRFLGKGERSKGKYAGPILVGVALGPVFASCSPTYAFILASVLPVSFLSGSIYLIAYAIGLAVALLIIAVAGRTIITRYSWAVNTHSWFRRILGIIFIAIGVAVFSGSQIKIETWVGDHLPFDETKIERSLLQYHKDTVAKSLPAGAPNSDILNVQPVPAPEFQGLTNWINSPSLTVAGLKGKVVLVDFWTYSCINCIRTLPYIEKWYQAYQDKGLVIVGVNTPEFAFEHNPTNVAAAVKSDKIVYPVALDNKYATWNAYGNDSWPADYLLDRQGQIRYVSKGEGDYDKTERAIQYLLGLNQQLQTPSSVVPITENQTPETYFGNDRAGNYVGSPSLAVGTYNFKPQPSLSQNEWTLAGNWQIAGESITSNADTDILTFSVSAKDVYMVASGHNTSQAVTVSLPSDVSGQFGNDAPNGQVQVSGSRLYHIVSLQQFGNTTVTLTVPKGVSLYTFTFGS